MKKTFAYLSCFLVAGLFACVSVADRELDELSEKLKEKLNEQEGGPGSGPCYVGRWTTPNCMKTETLQLNGDGTGYLALPDCANICQDLRYPFNYTVDRNQITLRYTKPPTINCSGYGTQQPDTPRNDTFTFTCSGGKLTTSANGSKTYSRQ